LALQDGEFNLHPFTEPPRRTIQGSWEFLLMEAARLTDEGTQFFKAAPAKAQPFEGATTEPVAATIPDAATFTWKRAEPAAAPPPPVVIDEVRIEEILLCSGSGEVLYELQCTALDDRLRLLEQVEQQATQLSSLAPLGRFDRMEILIGDGRVVCQVQPDRRLFVRSARSNAEIA
jgi:hypothetical protein